MPDPIDLDELERGCPQCGRSSCPFPSAYAATEGLPGFGEEQTPESEQAWVALGKASVSCGKPRDWRSTSLELIAEVRRVRAALSDGAPGETAEARARLLVADAADVDPDDLSCGDVVGVANLVAEVRALREARLRDHPIVTAARAVVAAWAREPWDESEVAEAEHDLGDAVRMHPEYVEPDDADPEARQA